MNLHDTLLVHRFRKVHPKIGSLKNRNGEAANSYWKWQFIVELPIENGDFP